MAEATIWISGLVKSFGPTRALDGLDLEVPSGQVHGFLGPNGAGKTTTLRILLGLLRADAGSVRLLGGDPWAEAVRLHRRLAYVPGDVTLWPSLTGGETIDLLGRLRGGLDPRRRQELLDRFELDPHKKARGHLVFSLLGPAAQLLLAGLACGLTYGLTAGDVGGQVARVLAAAVLQLPAVWVLAAVAVALVGLLPRLAAASWGVLAVCLLIGLVGAAFQLSQWLLDVSPFTHVPKYPGGAVTVAPLILLAAVAATLTVAGLAGLRRRDLPM